MPTDPKKENENNEDGGGDDAEAKLDARINAIVHKALTERDKRLEAKLTKTMTDALGKNMDELRQILVEAPPEPEKREQDGKTVQLPPEVQAQLKKTAADAAEAKKMAEDWKNKAELERTKNQRAEERQQLITLLSGKVKPALLDMVVDQLHTKHVVRDEEGNAILWKDADGSVVPIKDGATSWAKSDVGKEFAPPRDARGAGSRGSDGDTPIKPGQMTVEALGDIVTGSMAGRR